MAVPEAVRTSRLRLRQWRPEDWPAFAAMNADPKVARYLAAPLDAAASATLLERIEAEWRECGFGLWALEVADRAEFIGFAGLHRVPETLAFAPAVEVGWRLLPQHWDHGYATEAAAAALADGFTRAGLTEVVSFTTLANIRSQRVMQRLGMRRDCEFEHVGLPAGHPLRPHVLYRLQAKDWIGGR